MGYTTALNGDVVGYSSLIADNEVETMRTLKRLREIIEASVVVHDGEMASFAGDEFLAVFRSSREGVIAALQIQKELAVENSLLPQGRRMRFRLGLDSGSVKLEGDNWFGEAINIAARLQALADPGRVVVSSAVVDAMGDVDARQTALGPQRLKNIPDEVRAYQLIDDSIDPEGMLSVAKQRAVESDLPSLAVLPFLNLGQSDDDHFASGLMVSLVVSLMTIPGLEVVSEMSSLSLGESGYSTEGAASELGVRYILDGAIQRAGDQVRVTTQLTDTKTSRIIWAEKFEATIEDLFAAQDRLVAEIVESIDREGLTEMMGRARIYRDNFDAQTIEDVYKAWDGLLSGTPEGVRDAQRLFVGVSDRFPESALGWSDAAWAYLWEALQGWAQDPAENFRLAGEFATRGHELADPSGFATAVLAYVRLLDGDFENAYQTALEATESRPSCDVTYGLAASVMRFLGRWEEAVSLGNRASELSPLLNDWYRGIVANAYYVGGEYESAADLASSVLSKASDAPEALLTLTAANAALGRQKHAEAIARQVKSAQPGLSIDQLEGLMPYRDDDTKQAFVDRLRTAGLD